MGKSGIIVDPLLCVPLKSRKERYMFKSILPLVLLVSCVSTPQVRMEFDPDPLCRFKTGRSSSKVVEDILDGSLFNFDNRNEIEIPYRLPVPKNLPKGTVVYICSVR